jgi:hypothetical protein
MTGCYDGFLKLSRANFVTLLLVLLSVGLQAQVFPFDLWHDGKMVLETGDTLRGSIKYDLQDVLQIKHNGRLESFTARKVVFFEIFDQTYRRFRNFYSLPYSPTGGYKTPIFFEVLTEGKITVLAREKIEYRTYSSPFFYYGGYSSRLVLVNLYYLLKENGTVEQFAAKRNDWYDLMGSRQNEIHDYIKENHLDLDRKYDIKRIIDYYNSSYGK